LVKRSLLVTPTMTGFSREFDGSRIAFKHEICDVGPVAVLRQLPMRIFHSTKTEFVDALET